MIVSYNGQIFFFILYSRSSQPDLLVSVETLSVVKHACVIVGPSDTWCYCHKSRFPGPVPMGESALPPLHLCLSPCSLSPPPSIGSNQRPPRAQGLSATGRRQQRWSDRDGDLLLMMFTNNGGELQRPLQNAPCWIMSAAITCAGRGGGVWNREERKHQLTA